MVSSSFQQIQRQIDKLALHSNSRLLEQKEKSPQDEEVERP